MRFAASGFTVVFVCLVLLAGGAGRVGDAAAAASAADRCTVRGTLAYGERIALPEDGVAVVELRDARFAAGPLVAERRIPLRGKQVSIPFELAVVDVGTLALTPYTAATPAWTMRCGDQTITAWFQGDEARVQVGGETFELRQVMAASGARYMVPEDPTTLFWTKGNRARLTVRGKEYPECSLVLDAAKVLVGVEWVVEDIDGGGIVHLSRTTLTFGGDGRVTGSMSCNSYTAGYTVKGDSLTITQAASTLKACIPVLMTQEERFMSILRDVHAWTITPDGALVLRTADARTITARHD
jgi:putative lipoprotein